MSIYSSIEWTDSTWNPVTGCTKISAGCSNCYAETFAERWRGLKGHHFEQGFDLKIWPQRLSLPLSWRKPKMIFVNSMGDLFHDKVSIAFIKDVFNTMEKANWHTFQLLTKRSERLAKVSSKIKWPSNVWMGVSVESEDYLYRIDHLRKVPAAIKFISFEPLLGPLGNPNISGIDWVIVGGESGPGARPIKPAWVRSIQKHCQKENTPFFFKQWGGVKKVANGRMLDGRTWDQLPLPYENRRAAHAIF